MKHGAEGQSTEDRGRTRLTLDECYDIY
jgi:hypothetical protein